MGGGGVNDPTREAEIRTYLARRRLGIRAIPGLRPQDQEEAGVLVDLVRGGEVPPEKLRSWIEEAKRTNRVRRRT